MSSVNKALILGNVGGDPDIVITQSGTKFAKFSVATNYRYKDRSGNLQEEVEWHRITVWYDKLVTVVEQYVNKGDRIYVEGRIKYNEYETRDGVRVREAGIECREIVLLGGRKNGQGQSGGQHQGGGSGYQQPAARPAPTGPASAPAQPAPALQPKPVAPAVNPSGTKSYDDLPFLFAPFLMGATEVLSSLLSTGALT